MGRDSGIVLVKRDEFDPELLKDPYDRYDAYDIPEEVRPIREMEGDGWNEGKIRFHYYDILYWRKVNSIADFCSNLVEFNEDEWIKDITISQLEEVREEIISEISYPDEFRSGVWSWDEYSNHLALDLMTITWLIRYLKEHPDDRAMFYDSY
jgi:hypothetical protein